MYWSSTDTGSGFKQHPLISSQVHRSETQAAFAGFSAQGLKAKLKVRVRISYLEARQKNKISGHLYYGQFWFPEVIGLSEGC